MADQDAWGMMHFDWRCLLRPFCWMTSHKRTAYKVAWAEDWAFKWAKWCVRCGKNLEE